LPVLTTEERVGRTLDGKYKVGAPIAAGGMGVVYRGEHTWTGRSVAIKVLQPGLSSDEDIARRFLTEARASASLRHPNVVDVLDMGKDEDGTLYMVLELLEGRDFNDVIEERTVLTPAEVVAVMAPVLEALAFAHEKGFVHRDMKPSNVFLAIDARGVVVPKVLDFGIAKALDGGANKTTRTGVIIGTPHYMAPEQASGVGVIGPATDTWSVGVVLFEALSGRFPFDGASPTMILMNVLGKRAPALRDVAPTVPQDIAALVDMMLDPDPDARPADLRAHASRLLACTRVDSAAVLESLVRRSTDRREAATAPTMLGHADAGAAGPAEPGTDRLPKHELAPTVQDAGPPAVSARPSWVGWALGAVAITLAALGAWWALGIGPSRGPFVQMPEPIEPPPGGVSIADRPVANATTEPSAPATGREAPTPIAAPPSGPDPTTPDPSVPAPSTPAPPAPSPAAPSPGSSGRATRPPAEARVPAAEDVRAAEPATPASPTIARSEPPSLAPPTPLGPEPITEVQEQW